MVQVRAAVIQISANQRKPHIRILRRYDAERGEQCGVILKGVRSPYMTNNLRVLRNAERSTDSSATSRCDRNKALQVEAIWYEIKRAAIADCTVNLNCARAARYRAFRNPPRHPSVPPHYQQGTIAVSCPQVITVVLAPPYPQTCQACPYATEKVGVVHPRLHNGRTQFAEPSAESKER